MRWPVIAFILAAACTDGTGQPGNPVLQPFGALTSASENALYQQRRAQVELIVKSQFADIRQDIRNGGGPTLSAAMDAAGILPADRPARTLQLQSDQQLYETVPGALVTNLMIYAG